MKTMKTQLTVAMAAMALLAGCAAETTNDEGGDDASEIGSTSEALSVSTTRYSLNYHGGGGGNPGTISCGSGAVATGFFGSYGRYMNQIGLICAKLNADGSLGLKYTTTALGSPGPNTFTFWCGNGAALRGVKGYSGTYLDNWGGYCKDVKTGESGNVGSVGYWSGNRFDEFCPDNALITSLYVRSASWVDGARATCTYLNP